MNFQNSNVLILGDVMLDQYWFGATSRISPEAPVPVVHVNRVNERPGGAANVALGVAALGAKPTLLGLVGQDDGASRLERLLKESDVHHHLVSLPNVSTITKLRVLSRNQQMIRLDTEEFFQPSTELLQQKFIEALNTTQGVILSDYGKGTLQNARWFIKKAREKNLIVIVDPKSQDFSMYQGASILTPNLKEFEAVAGPCPSVNILVEKARMILDRFQIETLMITRSEHGLSVVTRTEAIHIPAVAREVHDVTGAGDTVVAVLATALASQMDLIQAATLSNLAAGIAVGKLGAAVVTVPEIQAVLEMCETVESHGNNNHHQTKSNLPLGVMSEERLLPILQQAKAQGEKVVFTNGCFDILHAGHVLYLEQARRLGDRVVVAVNTDESVTRLKGPTRPINSVEDRMSVLAGLKSVDWVVPFSEDTPERIIREISPEVLVKGGDYKVIEELPGAKFVLNQGGKVELLGLKEGRSTTHMIDTIVAQKEMLEDIA